MPLFPIPLFLVYYTQITCISNPQRITERKLRKLACLGEFPGGKLAWAISVHGVVRERLNVERVIYIYN